MIRPTGKPRQTTSKFVFLPGATNDSGAQCNLVWIVITHRMS